MVNTIELPPSYFSVKPESFGYVIFTERFTNIISKIIEVCKQQALNLEKENKFNEKDDMLKNADSVTLILQHLKNGEEFTKFSDIYFDYEIWNEYLSTVPICPDIVLTTPNWRSTASIFTECYYYRSLFECFQKSTYHKKFDYFFESKRDNLTLSMDVILIIAADFLQFFNGDKHDKKELLQGLHAFAMHSLCHNQVDLSLNAGNLMTSHSIGNLSMSKSDTRADFILVNHTEDWLNYMSGLDFSSLSNIIHIVLDNTGSEFFADLCLGLYFLEASITIKVIFHVKCFPWFVSDVILEDVEYTLAYLNSSGNADLQKIVNLINGYRNNDRMEFRSHPVWNLPSYYSKITEESRLSINSIYQEFLTATLVIFKGDMNYRRLTGDLAWPYETPFRESLGKFIGFPLLSLRTIKVDGIVGMDKETIERTNQFPPKWQQTGTYGLVLFINK